MTGQFGNTFFSGKENLNELGKTLEDLREYARETNKAEAAKDVTP